MNPEQLVPYLMVALILVATAVFLWWTLGPTIKIHLNLVPLMTVMAAELDEAESALLKAETAQEWATAVIAYNRDRIARLNDRINTLTETKKARLASEKAGG